MIQEQYISFEVAKLLKSRDDFHVNSKSHYNAEGNLYFTSMSHYNLTAGDGCIAPTQQLVMRWLREVHNIFISINITYNIEGNDRLTYLWIPCVIKQDNIDYPTMEEYMSNSYEQACEAAIKYCITNLI